MIFRDSINKVLIINPFGIGDVLFTTPVIHTLKDVLPAVKIGYLCNRRTASILANNPHIDQLYIYERDEFEAIRKKSFFAWLKSIFQFLSQIKEGHFDLALDFSLNTQYGFFSWYAGIQERIGYDYKGRGGFLTKKNRLSGYSGKHIVGYYNDLLKYVGLDTKYRNLELYLRDEDVKKAKEILSKEEVKEGDILVAIIPGGGKSWGKDAHLKHWPVQNYARLADKIVENYKAKIIILGDSSEKEIAKKVIEHMHQRAIDLCGLTTVAELAALLGKMSLVITNDGGSLHMAIALDKKTVSFFGPVDPKVYGPYPPDETRHIVLRKNLDCSPCYRNFRLNPCQKNRECLEGIPLEAAWEAVERLLK